MAKKNVIIAETPSGEKIEITTKNNKHKYSVGNIIFYIIDYAFFSIFTIACLFPFYYLFINTISDADLVTKGMINFVPKGININNYLSLTNVNDLGTSLIVSIARTILGTALMVAASAFVGYLMTKDEMWHRKFWYRFLVITMYFNAGLIPWYLNMSMLGLTNRFAAYIIPGIVAPYNIILVKTYIESIPKELEESAFIDGASYMTVFRKIVWPLSKPILATIAIFGAVGNWNSFQDSLILMPNAPDLYTLQHRLYIYLNSTSNIGQMMNSAGGGGLALDYANNGMIIKYTISMVSIIPILLVYPFMQRYFEEGIMLGAVKG
ncbi:MAG: carbohydrate ABC transporter permease [Eubacterium sp.]|nr:carbohydrate ABC transporter permease [Eubacterium sp.]